jgi:hypothetical protein
MFIASKKIRRHKDRNRSSRLRAKLRNKNKRRVARLYA